jgi:hypothetical protein
MDMNASSSLTSHPAFAGLSAALPAAGDLGAVVPKAPRVEDKADRRLRARSKRRRSDQIIGVSSLVGAAAAMPLVASPEAAAVLAVAAIALLAGERWAVGLVIAAELVLLGALLPFVLKQPPPLATAAALLSIAAAFPSMAATRRGAAALALLLGLRRTPATCRVFHFALLAFAALAGCAPLL